VANDSSDVAQPTPVLSSAQFEMMIALKHQVFFNFLHEIPPCPRNASVKFDASEGALTGGGPVGKSLKN
jgi:hypothetical protein